MAEVGAGKRYYVGMAKQTNYATINTTAADLDFLWLTETEHETYQVPIPNEASIGNNINYKPDMGNKKSTGSATAYMQPRQMGTWMNKIFGQLDLATPTGGTNARLHKWGYEAHKDDDRFGHPLTVRQTHGATTEDRQIGSYINKWGISGTQDADGKRVMFNVEWGGGDIAENGARVTSITAPLGDFALTPEIKLELAEVGSSYATVAVKDIEMSMDMQYHLEEYSSQPNGTVSDEPTRDEAVPLFELAFTIWADYDYLMKARAYTDYKVRATFKGALIETGYDYEFGFEFPKVLLKPEQGIDVDMKRSKMTLDFGSFLTGTTSETDQITDATNEANETFRIWVQNTRTTQYDS